MMEIPTAQAIKLAIVPAISLSKDALHIHVGLAVLLMTAAILRKPVRSIGPWLFVFTLAVVGNLVDMRDDITSLG